MNKNQNGNIANSSNELATLSQTVEGRCEALNISVFKACGYGCEVNENGDVRTIGHDNILKPQDRKGIGPQRYCVWFENKRHYPARWLLVARAWLTDYKDGMWCIWRNNDPKDCRVSNLSLCTKTEYNRYKTNMSLIKIAEKSGLKYGEFRPTGEKGIECTIDGIFKIDGKISNHHIRKQNGINKLRTIEARRNGINHYYNAKELVYRAWNGKISPDHLIICKDGDWTNIHADNLKQVMAPKYRQAAYHWQYHKEGDVNALPTVSETVDRLKEIQMECQLNVNYLENGDWSGYHKYISEYLYDYLMCFSIKTLSQSKSWANHYVAVVISDLYDLISTNRMMFSPKMFCCARLRRQKRFKTTVFAHKARPVSVQNEIDKLDLQKLADKFNNASLKKYHHKYNV